MYSDTNQAAIEVQLPRSETPMHKPNAVAVTPLNEADRTRCEVWTRVMGYHRPVSAFNPGKQSEHSERRCFEETRSGRRTTRQ